MFLVICRSRKTSADFYGIVNFWEECLIIPGGRDKMISINRRIGEKFGKRAGSFKI